MHAVALLSLSRTALRSHLPLLTVKMGVLQKIAYTTTLLIAAVTAQSSRRCNYTVGAPVRTTSGLVYGHRAPNATQVSEYLGIPFAQSPVGQLRFAPPVAYTGTGDIYAEDFVN